MKKRVLKVFSAFLFIAIILKVKYIAIDGFIPSKIAYFADYERELEIESDFLKKNPNFFDQKFFYLGKGRQSFVFESSDGKYVIKLVRYHKYRMPIWARIVSFFNLLTNYQKRILEERRERFQKAKDSYMIAYRDIKDATEVLYVHLNQTNYIKKRVKVVDKMGISHSLELDKIAFIIQRKIDSLSKVLPNLKLDDQKKFIDSFFEILFWRIERGVASKDFTNLIRNSGCDGLRFVELDVGSFSKFRDEKDGLLEFLNMTSYMRTYVKNNLREVFPYFQRVLEEKELCLKEKYHLN